MIKGIIPINKPKDWTSFDVVNKIKHMVYPNKVGHLGTLDPIATGVLLVTIGKATKLFDLMQEKQKTYIATFKFGYETDTLDATGQIINSTKNIPTMQQIFDSSKLLIGEIEQYPPKYSAKKIDGKRAYDLARKGVEFDLKPKKIYISGIKVLSYNNAELKVEITCSSGTYVRAIGRDIAYKLNSLATMTELVRTKIDQFSIENCVEIDSTNLLDKIIKIKDVLSFDEIKFNENTAKKILNGQKVKIDAVDGLYKLNELEDTIAIIEVKEKIAKMLTFLG